MDCLRLAPHLGGPVGSACCRCGLDERRWDRIAGKSYCPECQEDLVLGLAAPLREPTERQRCAACGRSGTVRYLTFPLRSLTPVEMDLCPEHLRTLLGRRLGQRAFGQLRRRLGLLGLRVEQIFLMHDAFYDDEGHALRPAFELD